MQEMFLRMIFANALTANSHVTAKLSIRLLLSRYQSPTAIFARFLIARVPYALAEQVDTLIRFVPELIERRSKIISQE